MPTVFNSTSDSKVSPNPVMEMAFPPKRSYRAPDMKVMMDSNIVPGTSRNPDKNALVPSTVCENIGRMVSVERSSIILIKTSISASVKFRFLNRLKSSTGYGMLNCLMVKNHRLSKPATIGGITSQSKNPYTLILLNPNINRENPIADNTIDRTSSETGFLLRTFFIKKTAAMSVMATRGSSTQCSALQSRTSMMNPEMGGAEAGATLVTAPSMPIANPLLSYGKTINNIVWTRGRMMPAPIA